jgi:hypothetical protein
MQKGEYIRCPWILLSREYPKFPTTLVQRLKSSAAVFVQIRITLR